MWWFGIACGAVLRALAAWYRPAQPSVVGHWRWVSLPAVLPVEYDTLRPDEVGDFLEKTAQCLAANQLHHQ